MKTKFAVIGTREMTSAQKGWVIENLVAERDTRGGHELHTGAAEGTDLFAATEWLKMDRRVVFHLPWPGYNGEQVEALDKEFPGQVVVSSLVEVTDLSMAQMHHPGWDGLSQGVHKLHGRNNAIIEPCARVYACPGEKRWGGGTAMGIKIACHTHTPCTVFDRLDREWDSCGCMKDEFGDVCVIVPFKQDKMSAKPAKPVGMQDPGKSHLSAFEAHCLTLLEQALRHVPMGTPLASSIEATLAQKTS